MQKQCRQSTLQMLNQSTSLLHLTQALTHAVHFSDTHAREYLEYVPCVGVTDLPHLPACCWRLAQPCCLHALQASGVVMTAPSLSQKQMSQIMSAGSSSFKQAALQPNTIPLSHGKVH